MGSTITYEQIFSRFLTNRIDDPKFMSLSPETANEFMTGWLREVISIPYLKKNFSVLAMHDDIAEIEYSLNRSDENLDDEYVITLLGTGMYVMYLLPQVNSTRNTIQMFGGKEEKFYSQAAHLEVLEEKLNKARVQFRKLIRDHNFVYIGGDEI